ncbi:MAG: hypothetical protein AUH78_19995 [Gemmatimonadetes bacterium 13_1_40CM_4_69_8]|nr:MAG: hypothetical protein AUH78_19995 [Gemmatimonadetes bacterium 13_1_40CM_4_69_8]
MRGPARIAPAAPSAARPATSTRRAWTASVTAAWWLLGLRAPAAQLTGTVDVGVSTVHYDGFLPSGAAALTPVLRWDRPVGTLTASGTYLRFESGHRSLQGLLAGSFFTPPTARAWRGEFAASAGASRYLDFASFWHAVAGARLHILGAERGLWIGGTAGTTSYGTAPRPVIAADVGVWARLSEVTLRLAANHSQVGDTTYTDLESSALAGRGPVALEARLGARVWSRGGGRGVYGEGSATVWVGGRTGVVISGGRYATDPISGSITGRYLSAALRVRSAAPRHSFARYPVAPHARGADGASVLPAARLEVHADRNRAVRLVVRVASAALVEIAGDFTDWQPVSLSSAGASTWEVTLPVPSGVHRIDVRIDGGAWIVPAGTTRAPDDYGGDVGIFVVP